MPRKLDTQTLENFGRDFAVWWIQGHVIGFPARDRLWMKQELFRITHRDEWRFLIEAAKKRLTGDDLASFEDCVNELHKENPRSDAAAEHFLGEYLAIDGEGIHVPGKRGKVQVGQRFMGYKEVEVEASWSIRRRKVLGLPKSERETRIKIVREYWPIYSGEEEERKRIEAGERDFIEDGADLIDSFPPANAIMALNTRISNECAILACDAIVDNLDEGTAGGVLVGRTGSQPTDPDTAASGTLLFSLNLSDPAFGAASDAAPGATATANSITDDSSADATGTLGYCRAGSSNSQPTLLDDHIDGEAGTSGADFNFNTLSITSGSTVSMTSWTATMPES